MLPKLPNVGRARLKKLREHLGSKWRFASIKQLREVDGIGAGLAAQIHGSLVAAGWLVTVLVEVPESLAGVPPTAALLPGDVQSDEPDGEAPRKRGRPPSTKAAAQSDGKAPRKRGRPRKAAAQADGGSTAQEHDAAAPCTDAARDDQAAGASERPPSTKAAAQGDGKAPRKRGRPRKAAAQADGASTAQEHDAAAPCTDAAGDDQAAGAPDPASRISKRPKLTFAEGAQVTIHKDHPKFAGSPATVTGVSNGPGAWVKCQLPNGTVTSVRQSLLIAAVDEA